MDEQPARGSRPDSPVSAAVTAAPANPGRATTAAGAPPQGPASVRAPIPAPVPVPVPGAARVLRSSAARPSVATSSASRPPARSAGIGSSAAGAADRSDTHAGTDAPAAPVAIPATDAAAATAVVRRPSVPTHAMVPAEPTPDATAVAAETPARDAVADRGAMPVVARSISPRSVGDVFLSPKVVDCENYRDFAGALKHLVEQAGGMLQDLEARHRDAAELSERLRTDGQRHQERLNLGGRLLRTVTSEIERVEQAARDATAAIDGRMQLLDRLEEEAEQLVRRFGERLSRAEHEVEDRLEELGTKSTRRVEEAMARLETNFERWTELQHEVDVRLERVESELTARLTPVSDRMSSLMREAERLIGETARCDRPGSEDDAGGDEGAGDETAPAGGVADCDRRSLATVLAEIHPLLVTVDGARDEVQALHDQWQTLRREAAEELLTAADLVDTLHGRREEVEQAVHSALSEADRIAKDLALEAAACKEAAERPIRAMKAELASGSERLSAAEHRVEDVLERLDTSRCELEELLQLQGEASSRMQHLMQQVEPWRHLLADVYDGEELPSPLLRVVDRVNASVGTQLHTLSRVLRAMSSQVERAAHATLSSAATEAMAVADHAPRGGTTDGQSRGEARSASSASGHPSAQAVSDRIHRPERSIGAGVGGGSESLHLAQTTGSSHADPETEGIAEDADHARGAGMEPADGPPVTEVHLDLRAVAEALERSVRRTPRPNCVLESNQAAADEASAAAEAAAAMDDGGTGGGDAAEAVLAAVSSRPADHDSGTDRDRGDVPDGAVRRPPVPQVVQRARVLTSGGAGRGARSGGAGTKPAVADDAA